jgi:hypothetical protein
VGGPQAEFRTRVFKGGRIVERYGVDRPARRVTDADDRTTLARVYTTDPWAAATWDVFAPDRSWLGQVHAPARFLAHVVHQNSLIGVWYDAPDVEHVRAYAFTPTRTSP